MMFVKVIGKMTKSQYVKNKLKAELAFVGIFGLLFLILYRGASAPVKINVGQLLIITFVFFSVGIFSSYLLQDLNLRFSSVLHAVFLPLSGTIFLYTRWIPEIQNTIQQLGIIYGGIIIYSITLAIYFLIHLRIHQKEIEE